MGYEVINLGGGRSPLSILETISIFEKYLRKKAKIENRLFHKADLRETSANLSKAKRLLDWSPSTDPQSGFEIMAQWYCSNRSWLSVLEV
jgi:UDP-glucuronate 4-epimerase